MKFTQLFEEFDQAKLVPLALKWLEKKFPKEEFGFTYKHIPNLKDATKTYNVSIEGKEFDIAGRIFDANGSGKEDKGDVVQFMIIDTQEEEEDKPSAFGE